MRSHVLAACLALAACDRSGPELPAAKDLDHGGPDGIVLPGDANGIWFDPARGLFLADETNSRLLRWTRREGFVDVASLPRSRSLTGLVGLDDGRIVIASFGFGSEGAVYVVDGATVTAVPNLDPARRRTGLAVAPDGALYVAYVVAHPGTIPSGGVARLDLKGSEVDVVTNLGKPVGIAATTAALFVTDQHRSSLVSFPRENPGEPTAISSRLAEPDLLTMLPDGDLIVGSRTGIVYRITPAGGPLVIASGFEQVRGTAYDPAGKRLFIVEHSASGRHQLHVVPLE